MEKEFCSYEQALALKELGFNEPCVATNYDTDGKIIIDYPDDYTTNKEQDELTQELIDDGEKNIKPTFTIPLKQQVFRWFREKHDIFGSIDVNYIYKIYNNDELHYESNVHHSYEEAEDACIDKLIELVKNK